MTYRDSDMFANSYFFVKFFIVVSCFFLARKLRKAMANLDDDVLSNHLTKVAWRGGIGILTPVAYVSMKGSSCVIANWNVEDIDDVCGGVVDPLLGVAFHLTAFFGHNLSFLPFQTFDFDDILALNVRWIQILHMVGISAATVVALFLFGSQREDEGAAVYVEVLVKFLWMSWFVISGTAGFDLVVTGRRRRRARRSIELPTLEVKDGGKEQQIRQSPSPPGIDNQDVSMVMGGEGVMLSPGLY